MSTPPKKTVNALEAVIVKMGFQRVIAFVWIARQPLTTCLFRISDLSRLSGMAYQAFSTFAYCVSHASGWIRYPRGVFIDWIMLTRDFDEGWRYPSNGKWQFPCTSDEACGPVSCTTTVVRTALDQEKLRINTYALSMPIFERSLLYFESISYLKIITYRTPGASLPSS